MKIYLKIPNKNYYLSELWAAIRPAGRGLDVPGLDPINQSEEKPRMSQQVSDQIKIRKQLNREQLNTTSSNEDKMQILSMNKK